MNNNTNFIELAKQVMENIINAIEQEDIDSSIDIDFHNDILTLTTDYGVFVINKQPAIKQIWLSSPISGPYHFSYIDGKWQSKNSLYLNEILTNELNININKI